MSLTPSMMAVNRAGLAWKTSRSQNKLNCCPLRFGLTK
jgi:hypothetical protein